MQRLEVSGAVRPIYGSLGVKRLISALKWISVANTKHFPQFSQLTSGNTLKCSMADPVKSFPIHHL